MDDDDYEVIDKRELEQAPPAPEIARPGTEDDSKVAPGEEGPGEVVDDELWKGYLALLISNLVTPSLALYQAAAPLVRYMGAQARAAGCAVVYSETAVRTGKIVRHASTVVSHNSQVASDAVWAFYSGAYSRAYDQAQHIDLCWLATPAADASTPMHIDVAATGEESNAAVSSWLEKFNAFMLLAHTWLVVVCRCVVFEAIVLGFYVREIACRLGHRAKLLKGA